MPRKRHSSKILGNNSFRNNLKVPEDKCHALDCKLFLLVSNYLSSCPWSMVMYIGHGLEQKQKRFSTSRDT